MAAPDLSAFDLDNCIFWDLETTGLNPQLARIVSITAVDRQRRFDSIVNPRVPIPREATAVHGVTDAQARLAPPWEVVGPRFLRWIADGAGARPVLCAYNGERYDLQVLVNENMRLDQAGLPRFVSIIHVDPFLAAQRVVPHGPPGTHRQANVYAALFGRQPEGQHTSSGDVAALVAVAKHPRMATAVLATARRVHSLVTFGERSAGVAKCGLTQPKRPQSGGCSPDLKRPVKRWVGLQGNPPLPSRSLTTLTGRGGAGAQPPFSSI